MVQSEKGMSMIAKADRRLMPVMTPGRAMGRMINSEICSRPKNRVRAIAPATSVPRIMASTVEIAATCNDSTIGGQMSARFHATANHWVVRPGGGNW